MKHLLLFFSLLSTFSVFAQENAICGVTINSSLPVGKLTFMCYNLGANPNMTMQQQMDYVSAGPTDATVYGDLYQWGRNTDGHEKRTSDTTSVPSTTDIPGHGKYILPWSSNNSDWREPQNNFLWGAPKTANDPCPEGWRIPSREEWKSIYDELSGNIWVWNDATGRYGPVGYKVSTDGGATFSLFLPSASRRTGYGISDMQNGFGRYWTSTISSDFNYSTWALSVTLSHTSVSVGVISSRAYGLSCRCIKEYEEIICNTTSTTINDTICSGEIYNFNGKSYNESGTYSDILRSLLYNCDSIIVTLNLTVNPLNQKTIDATICENEMYDFYGKSLNIQGVYRDTLHAVTGCDTVVTLNLTVNAVNIVPIHDTIYIGKNYSENGFDIPPQYFATTLSDTLFLQNRYDCDSMVVLYLQVICPSSEETPSFYETICQGESYNGYGFMLPLQNVSGSYTHRQELTDMYGCDSIVTLNLTVKPLHEETFTARIPINEPYNANGFSVPPHTEPGFLTFDKKLSDRYGCDSIVTLQLTVYTEIIPDEYFSPNGDGVKDVWNIKNIDYVKFSSINIYDRCGKLLVRYTEHFTPWNGVCRGRQMPSADYWYVITLEEEEKQYVGHFTLIR